MRVLVIDGEARTLNETSFCIRILYPGETVVPMAEGLKALEVIKKLAPEMIIVSSSLPDINALDLVRRIRDLSDAPLIFLTDGESSIGTAQALEEGADECIKKPMNPIEFLSVVKALMRRTGRLGYGTNHILMLGNGLSVNVGTREVFLHEERVKLTPHECTLLFELVRNRGRVVPFRLLLEHVWGSNYVEESNFIKKYVYRLRSKLETIPSKPMMILSERGIGYKIVALTLLFYAILSVWSPIAPPALALVTRIGELVAGG